MDPARGPVAWTSVPPEAPLFVTGGTAKALARVTATDKPDGDTMQALIDRMLAGDVPTELERSRAEVLLPGVVILWRLALHCGESRLTYSAVAIRDGMTRRLLKALERQPEGNLQTTQLLQSTVE